MACRAPAMVCAFQGWNDAGDAASTATAFLASALDASVSRSIDSRSSTISRPTARDPLRPSTSREISWPAVEIFEARAPPAPRDLVLVQGVEPSMRWRAFSSLIVDLADALGVQLVVTLGALLADVPHSRPVTMTGRLRPGADGPSWAPHLELRGPDRNHRRAARGLHRGRAALGEPVGQRPPLRRRRRQPEGRAGAAAQARDCRRRLRRRLRARGGRRPTTSARSAWPSAATRTSRRSSSASSRPPTARSRRRWPGGLPSGEILASEFQRFLRQRGTDGK